MLNKVILIGRLTHDPELRETNSGKSVVDFSIAVNRYNNDDVDFIGINAWERTAENVAKYLSKGSLVAIEGRIRVENYQDNNGNKKKSVKVVASQVIFLDSRKKSNDSGRNSNDDYNYDEISDEDVPF